MSKLTAEQLEVVLSELKTGLDELKARQVVVEETIVKIEKHLAQNPGKPLTKPVPKKCQFCGQVDCKVDHLANRCPHCKAPEGLPHVFIVNEDKERIPCPNMPEDRRTRCEKCGAPAGHPHRLIHRRVDGKPSSTMCPDA